MDRPKRSIKDVLREHTPRLSAIDGVVGTAQSSSEGEPCILVTVVELTPELTSRIPKQLDGYPVQILATGKPSLF